jgi:type III restriction enzyme
MELKEYQRRVLTVFDAYLDELTLWRNKARKIILANKEETDSDLIRPVPDFPAKAWDAVRAKNLLPLCRANVPYSPRKDGIGRDVPSICLKIPTGGGKTLLATSCISRLMGKYVERQTGVVLWIVPNEAIYSQTIKQLKNRDHPYRQMLDRAAAGRVKILEKDSPLHKSDVDSHLCILVLMLQSAGRQSKETLKVFRDRGNVVGFFPNESETGAHCLLATEVINLDRYADDLGLGPIIKDSLGNVLRLLRPLVIVDEGHKAYSKIAMDTVLGFNPRFVLELSATPKDRPAETPPRFANWLVDVRGIELAEEEMIKIPLNVKVNPGSDWRNCLRESLDHLNRLQRDADTLMSETARYVRPIMLVQVERTGVEQRDTGFIHSEDAKEFLLTAGLTEAQIAIKTSEKNELNTPENMDLLHPSCQVRVIITKQALQEGWDCPFAYVLCALGANHNLPAMTQLVGRILRQPHAARTGIPALDECHVFCLHNRTRDVVDGIKNGLENDGMADLALKVTDGGTGSDTRSETRPVKRRESFADLRIFLPKVVWAGSGGPRALDYEQDVLAGVDWNLVNVAELADKIPLDVHDAHSHTTRITVTDGEAGDFFPTGNTLEVVEDARFDPVHATRMITDLIPNPWIARATIEDFLLSLQDKGFSDDRLGHLSSYLIETLRTFLNTKRDALSETYFHAQVATGAIQFRLRMDDHAHDWRMPMELETDRPENARKLARNDGNPVQKSVFVPVFEDDFNTDEMEFACYLDEKEAMRWWHRNVAKAGQYALQGWRRNKVYPDFLFAMSTADGTEKIFVIETKGDQLAGNLDSEYKKKLLRLMAENYRQGRTAEAGVMEIAVGDRKTVTCDLVLMSEWQTYSWE